ncbi:hypothetical protein ACS0TY_000596 [Phlomoides rotata]
MAANSQQFSHRDTPVKVVQEVIDSSINDKLTELTSFVRKLAAGANQIPQVNPCRICSTTEHTMDLCPVLGGEIEAHANAVGNFQGRKYDPYSNTYNPGWRGNPNLRYGNQHGPHQVDNARPPPPRGQPNTENSGQSTEEMLRILTATTLKLSQDTQSSIKYLEMQMSQLATSVSRLDAQNSGKLPF